MVCAKCGAENVAGAKFCGECAAPLAALSSGEKRKTVTVLFCDLTGSTALGEALDPERLRVVLAGYFERMKAIVESHGGTVEKFIGDAVMAVFGVPVYVSVPVWHERASPCAAPTIATGIGRDASPSSSADALIARPPPAVWRDRH